jgi:hypothetical protein
MTPKEFKEKYVKHHYLTVGVLKKYLEEYPDDALVVSQRVEDSYYENHGWETLKRPDPLYPEFETEYTAVWGPVIYRDDKDVFYLDLHY